MGKIDELIQQAWSNLLNDCVKGVFKPENEYEIQTHLYYCLWIKLGKLDDITIRVGYPFPKKRRKQKKRTKGKRRIKRRMIDLAILRKSNNQPISAIEIKEYGRRGGKKGKGRVPENILSRKLKSDLNKLERLRRQCKTVKTFMCLFFRYTLDVEDSSVERIKETKEHCERRGITFLWGSFNTKEELAKIDQ